MSINALTTPCSRSRRQEWRWRDGHRWISIWRPSKVLEHSLDGRVRVEGSYDNFQLRVDSSLLLGVGTDERNGSHTFTVKTKVLVSALINIVAIASRIMTHLGERLAEEELVALLDKVSNGKGVLERVTGSEALVSLTSVW
jgi:hypothetical protein